MGDFIDTVMTVLFVFFMIFLVNGFVKQVGERKEARLKREQEARDRAEKKKLESTTNE